MSNIFQNLQLQRIADAIENGDAGGGTLTINLTGVGDMQPATASTAGAHGLVPAPAAGDQDKTLHGDGSWRVDPAVLPQVFGSGSGSIITLTDAAYYAASDLVIDIDPVQSGSGDPSPDNIMPISGWAGANIVVSPTLNAQDGTTYTIPFPSEVGTVYGGMLDVTNGTLTVDRGILTLNGSENYYYSIQSSSVDNNTVLRVVTRQACKQNENQKSNYGTFNNYAWQSLKSRANTFVLGSEGNLYLQLPSNIASTVAEFKALFASNPLQVCYELTTPITYQFTSTEVQMLLGTNNIWADTGDILTLKYIKADYNDLMQAVPKMKMPDYSTSEQDTGLKWIDGRAIYQKTFQHIALNHGTWSNSILGTSSIEILDYSGKIAISGTSRPYCNLDYYRSTEEWCTACVNNSGTDINVLCNIDATEQVLYITIWYLK